MGHGVFWEVEFGVDSSPDVTPSKCCDNSVFHKVCMFKVEQS